MTEQQEWRIHCSLHRKDIEDVIINGELYPILISSNSCRYIIVTDTDGKIYEYMEQNPNTRSFYAKRAIAGEQLTWRIPRMISAYKGTKRTSAGKWKLIDYKNTPKVKVIKTNKNHL